MRDAAAPLQYVVLHYTGMQSGEESVQWLCNPSAQVSAHYVVDENGDVYRLVDEESRAWHAGKSFWRGVTDINSASIGIELVNPGHEFGYRAFPVAQIAALKILLRDIIARRAFNPRTCLLAHSDIAPTRKQDPGELFPWQELAQEDLGVWPDVSEEDFAPDNSAEILLNGIGYDVTVPAAAILAFQRRFYPDNMTGHFDPQTLARLHAVNRQMKA